MRVGASLDPDLPAIHFLRTGELDEAPGTLTHAELFGRITQTANLLHDIGVRPADVVSFMLPLLPQACMVLFGAEAAGIVNPVNPMLEVRHIAQGRRDKVPVTLGPAPGTEIWEKTLQLRSLVPTLETVLQVLGPGEEPNGVYPFDALLDN